MTKIEVEIQKIKDDVGYLRKALTEDGGGGIIAQVKENTEFRQSYESRAKLYKFVLGSGWALTIVLFLGQLYINHGG